MAHREDNPLARSKDLIIEELGDEVLVYDTKVDRGHSLSPEAAKIWRCCDGGTSAEELGAKLGFDPETVDRALEELTSCELLEVSPVIVADGSTRREVTLRVAKVGAAAAAAPLILSVAASPAWAAVTLAFCLKASGSCGEGNPSGGCKSLGCCCCVGQPNSSDKCCVDTLDNCDDPLVLKTLGYDCAGANRCVSS